jgi:WD40 repeat protein
VRFSPNSQYLITSHGTIRVWDPATGRLIRSISHPDLGQVAYSPDGKRFVSWRWGRPPSVWDFATGRKLYTFRAAFPRGVSAAFSPDGRRIVTGSAEGAVWDAVTGRPLLTLKGHEGKEGLLSVAYSPDSRRIVTTGWDRTARVWDAATGRPLLVLRGHSRGVTGAAFSPDGKRIITGSWDKTVRVWNAATGDDLLTLQDKGHGTFTPDGRRLMAISADGTHTVKIWDIATPQQVAAWEAAERGTPSAKAARR